ncbi:hypothetical protein KQX54_015712, partial [Cotesia glomerata]
MLFSDGLQEEEHEYGLGLKSAKPEMIYLTQWVTNNNIELPKPVAGGFPETC